MTPDRARIGGRAANASRGAAWALASERVLGELGSWAHHCALEGTFLPEPGEGEVGEIDAIKRNLYAKEEAVQF